MPLLVGTFRFLIRNPLVENVCPHGVFDPLVHRCSFMEKPSVLEDEDASSFGVYIDSLFSLSVKE